jgi:hypothetical protein
MHAQRYTATNEHCHRHAQQHQRTRADGNCGLLPGGNIAAREHNPAGPSPRHALGRLQPNAAIGASDHDELSGRGTCRHRPPPARSNAAHDRTPHRDRRNCNCRRGAAVTRAATAAAAAAQ